MSDVPNPQMDDDEIEEVEEVEPDTGRVIAIDDPSLPDFAARRTLETWETPEGPVLGVRYTGEQPDLMSPADREAFVRAAMERNAASE